MGLIAGNKYSLMFFSVLKLILIKDVHVHVLNYEQNFTC